MRRSLAPSEAERGRDDKKERLYRKSSHRLRPVPRERLGSSVELLPLQRRRLILCGAFVCCVIPSETRNRSLPPERASRVKGEAVAATTAWDRDGLFEQACSLPRLGEPRDRIRGSNRSSPFRASSPESLRADSSASLGMTSKQWSCAKSRSHASPNTAACACRRIRRITPALLLVPRL